jgi:POT family proton-dependent oligopeptide transporter
VCSAWIGANYGYRWGFFAAGTGMLLGLVIFQALKAWLGHVGAAPAGREGFGNVGKVFVGALLLAVPAYFLLDMGWQNAFAERFAADSIVGMLLRNLGILGMLLVVMMVGLAAYFISSGIRSGEKQQLHRYIAMLILFAANILFWALFEQAGSSLNFLARDFVDMPTIFGTTLHFTIFQSVNPVFIILLAPFFAAMWVKLDKADWNPSIPRKFAYGLAGAAIGFYILVFAIEQMANEAGRLSWIWLTLTYLVHTMGELCLSPIGLAMVTKLARPSETGLAMGGWFLSIAMANYVAGLLAAEASGGGEAGTLAQYASVFDSMFLIGIVVAALFFLAAPLINKLMHGVK